MEYSAEVRRRFEVAGGEHGPGAEELAADAEDRALGVWARFEIGIRGEYVERVRFHIFGCPHTIAAASLLAEWVEGQPLSALQLDWSRQLAARLEVPEEKLGRLLVLEDALRACAESAQQG